MKRGGSCLGVENVDKPGLKEALKWQNWRKRLMLLSCPYSRMCHFFCVRLPVCLSETKEVQAGRNNSVTRMSLPVSPGCRSVSITTRGFPSLVPKFRLRRNSTGKHNEIILRPIFFLLLCFLSVFFLLLCKLQLERWIYLSFLYNQP